MIYKNLYLVTLLSMASMLNAEEVLESETLATDVIDPSDLTRVFTMASIWLNSQQNLRATASWAGSWSEDHTFMGFVEGFWGDKENEDAWGTDLLNVRAQYFHVIDTHLDALPKTGFSIDYMEEENGDSLAALGMLAMVPPSLTGGVQVFPNVAYMKGEVASTDVDGYMLNLYGTYPISNDGTFIQVWPEYISVSSDSIESESLTFSGLFSMPITGDRSTWFNLRLDHATKETKLSFYNDRLNEKETVVTVGVKFFL